MRLRPRPAGACRRTPLRALRRRGFTLLELLISLVLIALVASISIPAYFERAEVTLENAAVLLARDLRSAQNRAAYLGQPVQLSFDEARGSYRVWSPARESADAGTYQRRYDRDAVFEGVALEADGFDGASTLVFNASGKAELAGAVTLRYQGHVRIVSIEAPTGRIVVHNTSSDWRDRGFDS